MSNCYIAWKTYHKMGWL